MRPNMLPPKNSDVCDVNLSPPREYETNGNGTILMSTKRQVTSTRACCEKVNRTNCRNEEETCTTPTSTLIYGSSGPSSSSREDKDVPDVSSSTSNVIATTTTVTASTTKLTNGCRGNIGPCQVWTTSVVTPAPYVSSWNGTAESESDYVVDHQQGRTYYKGPFLGKGGFGRVYLMTDTSNRNQYACKIIPKNGLRIHMQKIAREVNIHRQLRHVNVVQLHHSFTDELNVYMLLEPCPRKSLRHVLKYRGKVTEPEARYYMKQMVAGVAYIHSQRIVHRDLKPGNTFLSDRMIVKIGDFGLAMIPDGQRRRVTVCGTPNYIAPEVLNKQAYSYEADVWALGCILYALLMGQPPFYTATLMETYTRIRENHYQKVDDTVASRNGQDLIWGLLQPNPELRPTLERVKEHPYLTKEYVPTSLPHTCCYQIPHSAILEPRPPPEASTASRNQSLGKAPEVPLQNLPPQYRRAASAQEPPNPQHPQQQQEMQQQPPQQPSKHQKNLKVVSKLIRTLSTVLCPSKKISYVAQSMQMHRALEACISEIKCRNAVENPTPVEDVVPLFVTKWIDYSNRYGLVFQLSDKSVGVLLNDNTKISYSHDRRRVEYVTTSGELTRYHREKDVPPALQDKLRLLRHASCYLSTYITEGGEIKGTPSTIKRSKNACVPQMRRWLRTDKTIVMELMVPMIQVNFFEDHTKIAISQESSDRGYLVTYIDTTRRGTSYWLNDLRDHGCTPNLYQRLRYLCKGAREFAKLDSNTLA